jgi:hypothetical protein
MEINSQDTIEKILSQTHTIAVVGLSSNPSRASYGVARYMQSQGYRIIPVNPNEREVLGERAYELLEDVPERIDLVNIFRRSQEAAAHIDSAIGMGVPAVWLQEGVIDLESALRASRAGLAVVMDRCILKEHIRKFREA